MRDQLALHPFGRLSIRSFLLFIATTMVASFAFLFMAIPTAHAAPDLTWSGEDIVYQGATYLKKDDIKKGSTTGLPEGTKVYMYFSGNVPDRKVSVIYFPANSDPTTSQQATLATYNFTPPDTYVKDPAIPPKDLTLAPQGAAQQAAQSTSCVVEGVGWIICPATNFMSKAMDWLFDVLSGFLTVRPVQTDMQSPMYRAWSMMRGIANVLFVIGFLVVIYSQVTNVGLSNYGIKRMLPRLIIAAILVNISYWICAILVDLSNIAGYSIQDMFIAMRKSVVGPGGNGWVDLLSFESLTGFVLSGGTAAGAAGVGLYVFTAGAAGSIALLMPILLGVIIAALVAVLVMAARQALITVLIVMSPFIFVAYLLPYTEKYFDKGRELFVKMLAMFPLFAIIFSGSQLAGELIIQNAQSINEIILGMGVKVAPIVITPFLMKLSGSLLGKVAGIVNNPGKGLIDRTRNKAQEFSDQRKARALSGDKSDIFARGARRIDRGRRKRSGWQKANEARADANWANSEEYSKTHTYDSNSSRIKEIGENKANDHYAALQQSSIPIQGLDIRARASKLDLDFSQAKVEANWEAVKAEGSAVSIVANTSSAPADVLHAINNSQDRARDLALAGMRKQAAERVQTLARGTQLMDNTATIDGVSLQTFAGGIDPNGAQRALADALTKQHSARGEAVKNAEAVIGHKNLSPEAVRKLALGNAGNSGIAVTDDVKEAAINLIAGGKNAKEIDNLLEAIDVSPQSNENHRLALSEALGGNSLRPKYISGAALGNIKLGLQPLRTAGVDSIIQNAVKARKLSPAALVEQDPVYLTRILTAIERDKSAFDAEGLAKLKENILFAYDPKNQLKGKLGDNEPVLDEILRKL